MSIDVRWDDEERTIIHFTYEGAFTWDELAAVHREMGEMMDGVNRQVDVITEFANAVIPDGALTNFPRVVRLTFLLDPRIRLMVVVGADRFACALVELFGRLYGVVDKLKLTATLEEACEIIAEHRRARDKSA
jgi:hypothetical protein